MDENEDKAGTPTLRLVKLDVGNPIPETPANVITSNAFEIEDEFKNFYLGGSQDKNVIQPPYDLKRLDKLCQENNALSPCIEAMVTNVDGTGQQFVKRDGTVDEEDVVDPKEQQLNDFFNECWPGMSFTTLRKHKRRDEERLGNAYFEVIRNPQGDIVFVKHIDAKMVRLLQLDAAVPVKKEITRNGRTTSVNVMARERRFIMYAGQSTFIYFKEFGASRDLNKRTGDWAPAGQKLPAQDRASEILHFKALPDATSPYGVPRWINQMPSVLGSRKAEEFNLDYFDNGGVPPVLIMVEGGVLGQETRKALTQKTTGLASKNNRVQVIETEPTGGRIDGSSNVRVRVERFGAERQSDSMFEKYDEKCEARVRRSFRLPPIFVGQAGDYSFATAHASYTVAEAQVFKPERDEFDEIITSTLLPAMGYVDYKMVSKPLSIEDTANKLKGIEMAIGTQHVEPSDVIDEINTATGTNLQFSEEPVGLEAAVESALTEFKTKNGLMPDPAQPNANGTPGGITQPKTPAASSGTAATKKSAEGVVALAVDLALAVRKRDNEGLKKNLELIAGLSKSEKVAFDTAMANLQFINVDVDPTGLQELAACTMAVMAHQVMHKSDCGCGAH